ncbi:helix-turn-helix domain-containing protein [Mucilaginibacter sp. Bleaf8]|uniref:AraC family transcriptional regulator n=1 Tax=Mucilaginibacter sp. Bleaf8 TaxID=2834430 RepID=UPI001BCF63B9|nr:helix-turn-helix transcriptional regulator [Mucilaginibacter sp. Bleaf8]MBS7566918.1 helix-turn-helix domain-containing protein [Mucilaginibacter sp. Bleaf8]
MPKEAFTDLPFQPMLDSSPIQLIRMNGFHDDSSATPHRHDFYMLCWTTQGSGRHAINFKEYDMQVGRAFFLHENQVHQVVEYPADGWLILFDDMLFQRFLNVHPQQEQSGILDYFNRSPWVDLAHSTLQKFNQVAELLAGELKQKADLEIILHYLSLLLLYTAQQYQQTERFSVRSADAELIRKLKTLIGRHYKTEWETSFYSKALGVPARKLNDTVKTATGKIVPDLITERLLSETEALLAASSMPMKEIAYELGFNNQSHLAVFFKKHTGHTPSAFRNQFHK